MSQDTPKRTETTQVKVVEAEKTFTQAELDKIVEKRIARVKEAKLLEAEKQELEQYRTEKKESQSKKDFIEAGGNPDKFASYKKVAKEGETYEDIFNEFPSLKKDEVLNANNLFNVNDKTETKPEANIEKNLKNGLVV